MTWITNVLPEVGRLVHLKFRDAQYRRGLRDSTAAYAERRGEASPIAGIVPEWWSLVDEQGQETGQLIAIEQALGWRPDG